MIRKKSYLCGKAQVGKGWRDFKGVAQLQRGEQVPLVPNRKMKTYSFARHYMSFQEFVSSVFISLVLRAFFVSDLKTSAKGARFSKQVYKQVLVFPL